MNVKLNCAQCQNNFIKEQKEYTRQIKRGRKIFFCSLSCAAIYDNKRNVIKIQKFIERNKGNTYGTGNRKYDPRFYHYIRQITGKSWKNPRIIYSNSNIDEEYLQQLWEQQKERCAISNLPIVLRQYKKGKSRSLYTASLDRIDSNIGYIKGNVQFVALGINLAKNSYSNEEMKEFIKQIKSA